MTQVELVWRDEDTLVAPNGRAIRIYEDEVDGAQEFGIEENIGLDRPHWTTTHLPSIRGAEKQQVKDDLEAFVRAEVDRETRASGAAVTTPSPARDR